MKLSANKGTTTFAVGDIDAQEFGIDTENGVIFDILRNKMYSNKIAAVAREISSNSRDANRENNKTSVPIEISIIEPNVLISSTDMQICFQDKGIGITPDRMGNIFLKYGSSTKRGSNRQTGGFGLGAKTPFAYTDTFTVITICDYEGKRLKYIYTASITDRSGHGAGEMIKFGEEETTDETGTAIIVPIKEGNRYEFEREIYRATCFWKVAPIYKNFKEAPWKFKTTYGGKGYSVIADEEGLFSSSQGFLIIIDGIPYAADLHTLGFDAYAIHNPYVIALEYKNGDLTISASREAVQYDRTTKTKLLWKHRKIQNDLRSEIELKLTSVKTYLESCILVNAMLGTTDDFKSEFWKMLYGWLYKDKERPKFQGKPTIEKPSFKYINLIRFEDDDNKRGHKMNERKFDSKWELPMYELDCAKRHAGKNATLIDNGGFILVTSVELILKEDTNPVRQAQLQTAYDLAVASQKKEMDELLTMGVVLNSYHGVIAKKLAKGEKTISNYVKRNDVWIPVRKISASKSWEDWESITVSFLRKEKVVEKGEKYIYFVTDKLSNFNAGYDKPTPKLPTSIEISKGILASMLMGIDCVVVSEDKSHYFKDAGMQTIDEVWKTVEATPTYLDKIQEAINYSTYKNLSIADGWTRLKLDNRLSLNTLTAVQARKKDPNNFANQVQGLQLLHLGIDSTADIKGVKKELDDLLDIYPVVKYYLDTYSSFSTKNRDITIINEYMDTIDLLSSKPPINEPLEELAA